MFIFTRTSFCEYFFFFFLYHILKSSLSSQPLPLNSLFISTVNYCRIHLPKPTQLLVISPPHHLQAMPFMASNPCSSYFSYTYLLFKEWLIWMLCFCFFPSAHLSCLTLCLSSKVQTTVNKNMQRLETECRESRNVWKEGQMVSTTFVGQWLRWSSTLVQCSLHPSFLRSRYTRKVMAVQSCK